MTKKLEETKQELITAPESGALPVSIGVLSSDFDGIDMGANDFLPTKILLMQGISQFVADRKAQIGDFVNNMTGEIVGSAGTKPVRLLPFAMKKYYAVEKYNGTKFVFSHIVEDTGVKLPNDFEVGGVKHRNMHTYVFFCMTEAMDIPVSISFRSTSHKEGQKLLNFMANQARKKPEPQPPFANWIKLDAIGKKNDQGNFMVLTTSPDSVSTEEERKECRTWVPVVKEVKNFGDEMDADTGSTGPAQPAPNVKF